MMKPRLKEMLILDHFRLGDQIYNLCLADAIRRASPNCRIRFICSPTNGASELPILAGFEACSIPAPWLQAGWIHRPRRLLDARQAFTRRIREIPSRCLCIDPRGGIIGHILMFGQSRLRTHIYAPPRSASWRQRALGHSPEHVFMSRARLLQQIGLDSATLRWPFLSELFAGSAADRAIALLPDASLSGKEWPSRHWRMLDQQLRDAGYEPIAALGPGSRFQANRLETFSRVWSGTIPQLGQMLASCRAAIAVDSFGGHYAAALGKPVLSLFGVTDPSLWRPWGDQNLQLRSSRANRMQFTRRCIETEGSRLMEEIKPLEVMTAFDSWQRRMNSA